MIRKLLAGVVALIAIVSVAVALFARGIIGGDAVRRALETQLSASLGQPVTIGSLGASFFPRVTIDMREVAIGQPARATIAEVSVATGLRGLLSRRVEDAEIVIANSRVPVEIAFGIAGAAASGGGAAASSALTIVSVKSLAFRRVDIVAGARSLLVDLQASLNGDRLDVTRLTAESAGTRLEATGALSSIARRTGKFAATAGRLNLDELLGVASSLSSATPSKPGTRVALDLEIALTSPGGELGGYGFQAMSTTIHVAPGQILLDPLRFGIFGGTYDGQLRVAPSRSGAALVLSGRIDGVNVATLLKETRGSTSMSGRMAGTVSLSADGGSAEEMLRTGRGSGRVTITDGAIPGLDMVRTIVLAFGKPTGAPPPGSGSAFTRIDSPFTLAGQTLRATAVTFASRDFDMTGSAVVQFPAAAIDMHANVALSRELTAQAGTDLRRYAQEDGRVIVPAVIGGTVAAPRVTVDVAAAVTRALQNEVRRKIKGLFDRIIK